MSNKDLVSKAVDKNDPNILLNGLMKRPTKEDIESKSGDNICAYISNECNGGYSMCIGVYCSKCRLRKDDAKEWLLKAYDKPRLDRDFYVKVSTQEEYKKLLKYFENLGEPVEYDYHVVENWIYVAFHSIKEKWCLFDKEDLDKISKASKQRPLSDFLTPEFKVGNKVCVLEKIEDETNVIEEGKGLREQISASNENKPLQSYRFTILNFSKSSKENKDKIGEMTPITFNLK